MPRTPLSTSTPYALPQEGSGDNKGLNEKLDSEDKEKIKDALKDGLSWLDSNPEAYAEEFRSSACLPCSPRPRVTA